MSFVSIYIHLVFATKHRQVFLSESMRKTLIDHIMVNSLEKKIHVLIVNGFKDHLHCLISLNKDQSIADVAQSIKGESSHWINKNYVYAKHFSWQDDYYAVSVGASQVDSLRKYIRNQADHHKSVTWEEELRKLEEEYDFIRIMD